MNIQRLLFVSGAANLGGVQSSTRARIRALERYGVAAHKLFFQPGAGIATYADITTFTTDVPRELDNIVRTGKYDAVSMINRVDMLPSLRRVRYRGRVLLEVRGMARQAIKACKTLTSRDVGAIIVISRYVRNLVRAALSADNIPIHVVYNTIDPDLFRPLKREQDKITLYGHDASERPIVLWVGRLSVNKNYAELLRIVGALVRNVENPPILWVVSDTNAQDNTKQFWRLVRRSGLGFYVRLFPCVPHAMMVQIYNTVARSGGCVLSTSKSEGFQNSLLEAMACGVPVVSSAVGGNVELVEDGVNGRLYPLGEPLVAARFIRQILNNDSLWRSYSSAGLARIQSRHSPVKHARDLLNVLEDTPVMTLEPETEETGGRGTGSPAAATKKVKASESRTKQIKTSKSKTRKAKTTKARTKKASSSSTNKSRTRAAGAAQQSAKRTGHQREGTGS